MIIPAFKPYLETKRKRDLIMSDSSQQPPQTPQTPQELNQFVENLLQQLQDKFEGMSKQILGRIDEMGSRIDDLEKSIATLMEQAGIEEEDEKPASKS